MQTIAFTTGLDPAEAPALATAAALAVVSGARLVTVHASSGSRPVSDLPHPEHLAERWGRAIAHEELVHTCCDDVTDTLLDALRRVKPELVIAGTHQRTGMSQLFAGSVAEAVARNIAVPTLIVPLHGPGLADLETGKLDLRRILVPAGDAEATRKGLEAAAWLAQAASESDPEVILLHVEDGTPMPTLDALPAGLRVVRRTVRGGLESAIAEVAAELGACAIVMATRGHDGVLDAFAGSHTERVLRQVRCPVLAVPIGKS